VSPFQGCVLFHYKPKTLPRAVTFRPFGALNQNAERSERRDCCDLSRNWPNSGQKIAATSAPLLRLADITHYSGGDQPEG
jgi:hypothetical protein